MHSQVRNPRYNRNKVNPIVRFFENVDYGLLFIVFLLIVIGLVMIYSTTAYKDGMSDFLSQLIAVLLGIGAMIAINIFPFKSIKYFDLIVAAVGLGAIIALLTPLKITLNNATRWFSIMGISVQSAEIVKITLIFLVARMLSSSPDYLDSRENWAKLGGVIFTYVGLLGVISSNLSSSIIILGICATMIFVASYNYKIYLFAAMGMSVVVAAVVAGIKYGLLSFGFRSQRIMVWLNPEATSGDVDNYQTAQALYAIGSGGIWGKGIGEGIQKINKIPEAQNDMIFSVLCEELGFVGAMVVIILFIALITRLVVHARNAASRYDALVITGVLAHIALQAVLNIAVVTNTIPNTGVSLPFISYGGSSVLCLLFEIGVVLSLSRNAVDAREN